MSVAEYSYLWDGSSTEWVLLRDDDTQTDPAGYVVANKTNGNLLVLVDDAIYSAVIAKMLEHGCRIMTTEEWGWRYSK